jgi:hypothetical protein
MAEYVFKETQKFNRIWIGAVLLLVTGITVWSSFFASPPKPSEGWEKILPLAIVLLVFVLMFSLTLKTRIDGNSLSFSYFPFIQTRKYLFHEIESMELIEYNGLLTYGGWGIKRNMDSWSYTTGGKHGIMVKTNKKKFLLGTQMPLEAQKAIDQFKEFNLQSHGS